jgi:hypothetical protein
MATLDIDTDIQQAMMTWLMVWLLDMVRVPILGV